jgi:hypothetical protein
MVQLFAHRLGATHDLDEVGRIVDQGLDKAMTRIEAEDGAKEGESPNRLNRARLPCRKPCRMM